MTQLHTLLSRQLRRYLANADKPPPELRAFIAAVDAAYRSHDEGRLMLERAFELSSDELLRANAEIRIASAELEKRVEERTAELSSANLELTAEMAGRRRFEDQLIYLASHDPLTTLYNRRRFEEELERELLMAASGGPQGALLFLDVDQFKDVNDSIGHRAGDELLQGLAHLLSQCVREQDVLSRSGGVEFSILLPYTTMPHARATPSVTTPSCWSAVR